MRGGWYVLAIERMGGEKRAVCRLRGSMHMDYLIQAPLLAVHSAEPGHAGDAVHSSVSERWCGLSGQSHLSAGQPLE